MSPESFRRYPVEITLLGGWFCLIVFGAGCLLGLCSLLTPTKLILTPEGFQIHGLRLKPLVPWNEVERFTVSTIKGTKFVSFRLKAAAKSPVLRPVVALLTSTGRADGYIPTFLERDADEVGVLLEEWRTQHSGAD